MPGTTVNYENTATASTSPENQNPAASEGMSWWGIAGIGFGGYVIGRSIEAGGRYLIRHFSSDEGKTS